MKKRCCNFLCLIPFFMIFFFSGPVFAACNVSSTPVTFGDYDTFSPAPLETTGSITVDCDETPPPNVTISIGPSPNSGGFNPRKLKLIGGSDLLEYNLFTRKSHTRIWGDGSGDTYTERGNVNKNKAWVSTVFARILPGQNVSSGPYNETLTVTITW